MKVKYTWHNEYANPDYWNKRTSLWQGMPIPVNFYFNLNDNKIRKFLKKRQGKILDVGCGDGRFLDYTHVGVDFSRGMLLKAKGKKKHLVRADAAHLPFRNKRFNVAFMVDVSLHIKPTERQNALEEMQRVASKTYDFLLEHRSYFPLILQKIKYICPIKILTPYIAFLCSFFVDRNRGLIENLVDRYQHYDSAVIVFF